MNEKDQEVKVETQSEVALTARAVGNAEEAAVKTVREAAQEARRKGKEAKNAELKARKEAQLVAKEVKKAKKAEARATRQNERIVRQGRKRRTIADQGIEQAEVELTKGVKLAAAEGTEKEAREAELYAEAAAKVTEAIKVSTQLYEGMINIVVMPPAGALEIKNLEEKLHLIQNLRVILISGSVDEPSRIIVSAEQSIPLIDVLSQIDVVDQVTKKGKEIQILLKSATQPTIF